MNTEQAAPAPAEAMASGAWDSDTDADNARLFADQHRGVLRWVPTRKRWLHFNGTYWADDLGGAATRAAEATARSFWVIAEAEHDDHKRGLLLDRGRRSMSRARLAAMAEIGRAWMEVGEGELDADPWLLNVLNGTLDLREDAPQLLRPHDPGDLITRVAPVSWDPLAASGTWDRFLATSLPDDGAREFLRRVAGYCLVGVASEERFFFVHGPAATGKSTFAEALSAALGPYAAVADPNLLLKSQRPADANAANPGLVHLVGRRLAVSSEPPRGRSFDEGLLKRVTGGDRLATRQMYGAQFEFVPQFTLVVLGNSRPPTEDDAGGAMSRRLVEVPFAVPAGDRRDDSLKAELTDAGRSGAAVLRWAVDGCREWRRHGLAPPDSVVQATQAYWSEQADNDPVATFIEEHFERTGDAADAVQQSALAEEYRRVVDRSASSRYLASRLRELEVRERKTSGTRFWTGLRRRPEMTWEELLARAHEGPDDE